MQTDAKNIDADTLDALVEFHGHMCPGLAMGVLAARVALDEIGPHAQDEEVVAVTETDMCGVDAVQFLTGCTFGKGNLIHEDYGKNAFTFFRRSDGHAIRVSARPGEGPIDQEHGRLFAKVQAGEATEEERARFSQLHQERSLRLLAMDPDELFEVERFMGAPPQKARIHDTIACADCGERVMATRLHQQGDDELCPPCYEAATYGGTGDRGRRPNHLER